jgi:lysophospholipase L1-like esterase
MPDHAPSARIQFTHFQENLMKLISLAILGASLLPLAAQSIPAASRTCSAAELLEQKNRYADWPDYKFYRAANAALPAAAAGEKRVVFFGSSTIEFWGKRPGSVFFPGKPYVNRGISGETTMQMLLRFQQDVVALHPTAFVFLGGANDVAGNSGPIPLEVTENNIKSMVEIAQANGIKVILASQTPTIEFPWNKGIVPGPKLLALSAWEKEFAASHGAAYVDFYSAMVGPDGSFLPGLSEDGAHPTAKGYEVMAPIVEHVIREVVGQPEVSSQP